MANYAVIENETIVNCVVAQSDYASKFENWIEVPNGFGIGDKYDNEKKLFIKQKPFESWILNEQTGFWNPPVPMPEDDQNYIWDEISGAWKIFDSFYEE